MYNDIHDCLAHAVTRFDRTRRAPQNPYALGQYLLAVERACKAIRLGATINAALVEQFTRGPLLDYVQRFVASKYSGSLKIE